MIAHCHHTGNTMFLLPQRGSKDCIQTMYGEKSSSEREGVWWYSWVVSFCQIPYLIFVTKFELLCGLKIFSSTCTVSVYHSLNIFVVGGKLFCSTGRSFPNDSVFACKTKSVWRTRTRTSIVAMEFTVQVSSFC